MVASAPHLWSIQNARHVFSVYRKKKSEYKVGSEPVTITNKVASDELDQQSNEAGKEQAAVQQNVYDNPAPSDSLTIKNNNASSTSTTEQLEMQKVQQ